MKKAGSALEPAEDSALPYAATVRERDVRQSSP